MFALDWHLCKALGLPVSKVPTLDGTPSPEAACGDAICLPPVRRPRASQLSLLDKLPWWVMKIVGRFVWFRPVFLKACVRCGKCVKACPADALKLEGKGLPRLEGARCIGCCCCSEVCPVKAVVMRSSWLVRMAGM